MTLSDVSGCAPAQTVHPASCRSGSASGNLFRTPTTEYETEAEGEDSLLNCFMLHEVFASAISCSRPLRRAVDLLDRRLRKIWHDCNAPNLPSLSPALKASAALLFQRMDRSARGHVNRVDAHEFFATQPNAEEHVEAFFAEVGVWTTRRDGDVDWAACERFWQTYLGPYGARDAELIRLSKAMLRYRSFRWDDGRHLHQHEHQHDFPM